MCLNGRSGRCILVQLFLHPEDLHRLIYGPSCAQSVAFSQREGIALSTITYNDDGVLRPLLYRLSLAEMVVPYGAPEHPHTRKFAFDVCVCRTPQKAVG
jgi:hypothetical protein